MASPNRSSVSPFRFQGLAGYPVVHGVTTRHPDLPGEGDINIAGRLPREQAVQNRAYWCEIIGVDPSRIVAGRQVHGNAVQAVSEADAGRGAFSIEEALPNTDALTTNEVGLPLMVYTADCVPVIIYDPKKHAVGLAHAGWRGTTTNVSGALVEEMVRAFGSDPATVVASIGPSIGPCCYEVGDEVIEAWNSSGVEQGEAAVTRPRERFHFDLWQANALELQAAGVRAERIELAHLCTQCQADRFFSRRAGNGHRGLFATIVALAPR